MKISMCIHDRERNTHITEDGALNNIITQGGVSNPAIGQVQNVEGGALECSQTQKCNSRGNNFVISRQGWSVAGEELSHIVCMNQIENEQ